MMVHWMTSSASQYGQISVPLAGSEAIMVSLGGDTDSAVALVVDDRRYRPVGLVAGDSGLYHYEGHRIRLTKDGRAIVTCKTVEVYADERGCSTCQKPGLPVTLR
jgi:phage baseplate assembly protein V